MTLLLDSRFPLVWRSPDCVQFGVDTPRVVLTGVTASHERMLAALAVGVTASGLELIGSESGMSAEHIRAFRRDIDPVLFTPTPSVHATVAVAGDGATADRIEWRLREAGLEPQRSLGTPNDTELPADAAVILGHFVLDPERRQQWLRRDIPHLPIVFGDTSVTIGPFIEPGAGPCLYCLELHHRDSDPAWPALAAQLLGKNSEAETPFFASETATFAARVVLSRLRGRPAKVANGITIDAETGEQTSQSWRRHPECACAGIPEVSELSRQEIATPNWSQGAGRPTPTRRGGVVSVRV